MTKTTRKNLRLDLVRFVELAVAAKISVPSQATSEFSPSRIGTVLFDTLAASGIPPEAADLDLCKELVVRATRINRHLAESRVLVES